MASCKLLGLVAKTLLCRVWLQVAGVGCDPLDVVFGGSDWQMLERNNKERLKK